MKGLQEVYGKTPVMAQVECQQPGQGSFIYTRTMSPPKSAPSRDPCNYPGAQLAAGGWLGDRLVLAVGLPSAGASPQALAPTPALNLAPP